MTRVSLYSDARQNAASCASKPLESRTAELRSVRPGTHVLFLDSLVAIIQTEGIIAAIRAIARYKSCSADQLLTRKLLASDTLRWRRSIDPSTSPEDPRVFPTPYLAGVRLLCEENLSSRFVLLFSCPSASLVRRKSQGFTCNETKKSYSWGCLSEPVGTLFRRSLAGRRN